MIVLLHFCSSILCKSSAERLGYFSDPFLRFFVKKAARRTPIINRGYYLRWKAIHEVLGRFVRLRKHGERLQVVSLGCGFDSGSGLGSPVAHAGST